MLRIRSFSILCAVTVLVIIAAVAAHQDTDAIPGSGEPLFPSLLSAINEVEKIRATSAGKGFTLERGQSGWVVLDRYRYPADADKVHSLLVGAAGLKRIEPKTRNPKLYSKLGLDDGADQATRTVAFVLEDRAGAALASWITGNAAPSKGDPEASEIYVRLNNDPQSWLVEGKVPRDGAMNDWLDRIIVDVDRKRVRQVRILHQNGEAVVVSKKSFEENDFVLEDMPADMSVNGQWRINDIGRVFTSLELADVQPRDALPKQSGPYLTAIMHTFDGLQIELSLHKLDDQSVCVLTASFDEGIRDPAEARLSSDKVREEAALLQAKWKDWLFMLPDFKVDHLAQKRAALLKGKTDDGANSSG